jgi:glycosyltransferase involved in cell wall biosynthesis
VRIFTRECCSLVQAGYALDLVIGAERDVVREGVHIHALRLPRRRLLRMAVGPWIALRAALRTRCCLYHYHDPELIGMGFVLRWVLGKKVVFDIHECVWRQLQSKPYLPAWLGRPAGWLYRCVERVLTLGQVKVVANAHSRRDYRNSILVQNFPRRVSELIPVSRPFSSAEAPLLVYLGHVSVLRGAHAYIDLAQGLKRRGRAFKMMLIGEHPEALHHELCARVRRLGLTSEVDITGRMDWFSAMRIVSRATIGLCLLQPAPNYTRCLATKILEYMMVGTPVLASNFDTWRPFVEAEDVGVMTDPTDSKAVLRACERMLDDREGLAGMSRRGRAAVQAKYDWDKEFETLLRAYETLLGGGT